MRYALLMPRCRRTRRLAHSSDHLGCALHRLWWSAPRRRTGAFGSAIGPESARFRRWRQVANASLMLNLLSQSIAIVVLVWLLRSAVLVSAFMPLCS